MFSSLPKLADKAFIVGFVLPVIVLFGLILFIFHDFSVEIGIVDIIKKDGSFDKIIYLAFILWSTAVTMMIINNDLYRLLEGYSWPKNLQDRGRASYVRERRLLDKEWDDFATEWASAGKLTSTQQARFSYISKHMLTHLPPEEFILPTRFGNAVRAFEIYSLKTYGADSIPLWVHLSVVVGKEFKAEIEDARAQVNCLLNLFYIFIACSSIAFFKLLLTIRWLYLRTDTMWAFPKDTFRLTAIMVVSVSISLVIYCFLIKQVVIWGTLVKAAFDCYLPELASKMGYELPNTEDERYAFWQEISSRSIFGKTFEPGRWLKKEEPIVGLKAPPAKSEKKPEEEDDKEADEVEKQEDGQDTDEVTEGLTGHEDPEAIA